LDFLRNAYHTHWHRQYLLTKCKWKGSNYVGSTFLLADRDKETTAITTATAASDTELGFILNISAIVPSFQLMSEFFLRRRVLTVGNGPHLEEEGIDPAPVRPRLRQRFRLISCVAVPIRLRLPKHHLEL
jgi:hypothetical protein